MLYINCLTMGVHLIINNGVDYLTKCSVQNFILDENRAKKPIQPKGCKVDGVMPFVTLHRRYAKLWRSV
jgi:hypothetical protein